jgi:carbonic anhydrase
MFVTPHSTTPDQAIRWLKEGNARFTKGQSIHQPFDEARLAAAADGQRPFAAVVSCSDSRCPVEILFDQSLGDLFVVRAAGNVCGPDQIGSIDFAVDALQTPAVVVLGHSLCGAVSAALQPARPLGHLGNLLARIQPAVDAAKTAHPQLPDADLVSHAIRANVWQAVSDLIHNSPLTRERLADARLTVVGALYDVATGQVEWLGPHPHQNKWLNRLSQ